MRRFQTEHSPDLEKSCCYCRQLKIGLAIIHKERKVVNQVSRMILIGDVAGKNAIIVDDIADTCGTLALAAQVLTDHDAEQCLAVVTHGFLSGRAIQVI